MLIKPSQQLRLTGNRAIKDMEDFVSAPPFGRHGAFLLVYQGRGSPGEIAFTDRE